MAVMNRFLKEGMALQQQGKYPEAYQAYINAIKDDCNCAEAYNILGVVLRLEKKYMASVACLEKAEKLRPTSDEFNFELGESLRLNKNWPRAESYFREAIKLNRNNPKAWYGLACILSMIGKNSEADQAITHAIRIEPKVPNLKWFKAINTLMTGNYDTGFKLYESRRLLPEFQYKSMCREWDGIQDLTGKTLYVESEQGLGDVIQFIRFIKLLPTTDIICGVPNELRSLLESSYPEIKFVSYFNTPPTDYFVLTGSLAMKTKWGKTPETLPPAPYLKTNKFISIPRPANTKKTVGVVFQGSLTHQDDFLRSSNLETFYKNLTGLGTEIYSLQYKPENVDPALLGPMGLVHDMSPFIKDFSDSAAIIKQLDHVVSVDTSMVHLAGALGVKCSVVIPFHTVDWRWGATGTDSCWYPSVTLYRQAEKESWDDVLLRIKKEI